MNEPLILDGKNVAEELYSKLPNANGKELAIITIGEDDASKVYVRNKIKACEKIGLKGINYKYNLNDYISWEKLAQDIENKINELNNDDNVVGIMIQQPYPKVLKAFLLEECIISYKDVDGLNSDNMYNTLKGEEPIHYPATPKGIITLLDYYNIPIEGKNVVIIGRSDIVGKPLAAMMVARNATVTLCHSKTSHLEDFTRRADIIISAVGKPKFITKEYISTMTVMGRESLMPVIIDVGMNRDENGKLCGDVDFNDVLPYCSAITRVPGGVGKMTIWALLDNCLKSFK